MWLCHSFITVIMWCVNVRRLGPMPGLIHLRHLWVSVLAVTLLASAQAETLEQAFDIALSHDARLLATQHQVSAAASGLAAAKGLALPRVSLDALYNRFSDEPAFRVHLAPLPAMALPFAQQEGTLVHAGVTWPLYTGGRLTNAAKAADATLAAAQTEVERTRQDLKLSVAEAYVSVLRAKHLLALADSNVTTLSAHLRDVNAFLETGLVARSDALAARTAEASAWQDRLRAATALEIAQASYNRLLGRALEAPVTLEDQVSVPEAEGADVSVPASAANRVELVGLAQQGAALQFQSAAALAAGRPQVVLSAGYSQIQNRYLDKDALWNMGVGLSWELFDGGVHRSQADALRARAAAVAALHAELESQIALQVHAAKLLREESRSRIAVAATAITQAEENLRVARDRYQSGVGSHTEVLDAETLRIKSGSNHFNALYDHMLAVQRLKRANGEL